VVAVSLPITNRAKHAKYHKECILLKDAEYRKKYYWDNRAKFNERSRLQRLENKRGEK